MTITEKAAYLKGLIEGRGFDTEAGEGKLWSVLSELMGDIAEELNNLRIDHEDMSDSMDELEEELEYLELLTGTYDDDEDDYDFSDDDGGSDLYPFKNFVMEDGDDAEEDEEEPGDEDGEEFGVSYEVECPNCGEEIEFDEETLENGSIFCPNCGAILEFQLESKGTDAEDRENSRISEGDTEETEDETPPLL